MGYKHKQHQQENQENGLAVKDSVKVAIQVNRYGINLISGESILAQTGVKIEK